MSFKQEKEKSVIEKRFVTETEVEEIKKKREEEWELARQEGREIDKEEEYVHDGRTLYERLKEQKDKKQEEFEEQLKFKNMIYQGLDKEDASFLTYVSGKQAEFHGKRFNEDDTEIQSYRAAVGKMLTEDEESIPKAKPTNQSRKEAKNAKTSTKPKVTGVIIRKRLSSTEKTEVTEAKRPRDDVPDKAVKGEQDFIKTDLDTNPVKPTTEAKSLGSLIAYSDSSDSDE